MFLSYLSLAWRRLIAHPVFSAISILGLSAGICCFVLALLFVEDELSFDRFWKNAGHIFLVETSVTPASGGEPVHDKRAQPQIGPLIDANLAGARAVARHLTRDYLVSAEENRFYDRLSFVDPALFEIMDAEFVSGSARESLQTSMTVVLTQSAAARYFGTADPIDQYLTFDGKNRMRVAGVIRDLPANTHFEFSVLTNTTSLDTMASPAVLQQWRAPNAMTYVLLDTTVSIDDTARALQALVERNVPEGLKGRLAVSLTDIGDLRQRQNQFGSVNTLPVVLGVGALVLLMACINTVNLTTARGAERTRELGARKVLGATRRELMFQFQSEAILTAFISLLIGVLLVELTLPWINRAFDKALAIHYFTDGTLVLELLAITLVTAVLSGAYPAFVLSRYKAVDAFRGDVHFGGGASALRTGLLVLQFAIAVTLSIATVFVFLQMRHIRTLDLGFDRENVVILENLGWTDIRPVYETLKQELLKNGNIRAVSASVAVPGREFDRVGSFRPQGSDEAQAVGLHRLAVDFDFFKTYAIPLLAGRVFSRDHGTDVLQPNAPADAGRRVISAIINASAAKRLGWSTPQEALGQVVVPVDQQWSFDTRIIGVVKDFHMLAGRGPINPYIFIVSPPSTQFASIRIAGGDVRATLDYLDETWNRLIPQYPIVRYFLDDDLQAAFASWERNGRIMIAASVLAILIAALGSVGLAAYSTKCRRKEVGVRKVLGASSIQVTGFLTWELSKPVLLANLLALPVAFLIVRRWLEGYAYRLDITPNVFVLAAVVSTVLSAIVVSFHTFRAARTSPATTFRHL